MKSVEKAVEMLNSILETDKEAVIKLLNVRVPCNKHLADHPTVQVSAENSLDSKTEYSVGFLGMMNGVFGVGSQGSGLIAIEYESQDFDKEARSFRNVNKFVVIKQ